MSMKGISTMVPQAVEMLDKLTEHYKDKEKKSPGAYQNIIIYLQLTKEAVERLEPQYHDIDGRCPKCFRRFSEREIKEDFYCPQCGQAFINPDKHREIM